MGDIAEDEDSRTASVGKKRSRPEEHLPHESTSSASSPLRSTKRAKLDTNADFVSLEDEDAPTASVGQKGSRTDEDLQHGSASSTSLMSRDFRRAKLDPNADFVSLEDRSDAFNPKSNLEPSIPTNGKQRSSRSQSPSPACVYPDEDRDLQIHLTDGAQIHPRAELSVPSFDRSQYRSVEDQQLGWEVCLEPTPSLAKVATTKNDSLLVRDATKDTNGFSKEAPPRVLSSLSDSERRYQQRYWGLTEDYALARCPVCSAEGHMEDVCPTRTCRHCGVRDDHFSNACPRNLKCKRCRGRGHSIQDCPSKLARSNADGFSCNLCRQHGHVEENCSLIWRTFDPDKLFEVKKVDRLVVSCYECGSDRHWGNDCLIRPRNKSINCDVYSAKYANRYLFRPIEPPNQKGGFSIKGRANLNVVTFPSNEEDNDPSAFYRKKPSNALPPKPLPNGNINIQTLSFAQHQGGGRNSQPPRQGDGGNPQLSQRGDGNSQPSRLRGGGNWQPSLQGSGGVHAGAGLKEERPNEGGRSNWQPPLPREPLPQRPAIPPSPQKKRKRPPPVPVPADSFRPRR